MMSSYIHFEISVINSKYIFHWSTLQVLEYLLDDVSDFLSTQSTDRKEKIETGEEKGCVSLLNSFIDYITERERENFRSRRRDNENSVTLTTIHQVNTSANILFYSVLRLMLFWSLLMTSAKPFP